MLFQHCKDSAWEEEMGLVKGTASSESLQTFCFPDFTGPWEVGTSTKFSDTGIA